MKEQNSITTKQLYICFVILTILPCCLIFSKSVWFDETYTLALIKHNIKDMLDILNKDMHPPLYFLSLKAFCSVFGYDLVSTKVFSFAGYALTILLGPTIIKNTFSSKTAFVFMLSMGAVPMCYYFAVQQRSYSNCILFVVLSFVFAVRFLREYRLRDALLLAVFGLLASYNHIYALLACGIIFAFVNVNVVLRNTKQFLKVLFADIFIILGYLPQVTTLLSQVEGASSDFWLSGVEPLSILIFIIGAIFSIHFLIRYRNHEIVFAIVVIMSLQIIGLIITVFVRPLYIARYSVVVLGIFVLLVAMIFHTKLKRCFCLLLCVLNIACLTLTCAFEYDSSLVNFVERFDKQIQPTDTILYLDSSFGIVSYYFPENAHICTYRENWFDAFDNVSSISKNEVKQVINKPSWLIKNVNKELPEYITNNFNVQQTDMFRSDFNKFNVYKIEPK